MDDVEAAAELSHLYAAVYLRFHRRRSKSEPRLTLQQWAVLKHLTMAGPLTVGECARHLERAQSVVSEIIHGLEARKMLERLRATGGVS